MNLIHTFLLLRVVFKKYNFKSPNLVKLIMRKLYEQKIYMLKNKFIESIDIDIPYTLEEYMLYRPEKYVIYDKGFIYNIYECCKSDKNFKEITSHYNYDEDDVKLIYSCLTSDIEGIRKYPKTNYLNYLKIFIQYYNFKDVEFAKEMLSKYRLNNNLSYIFNPNIYKHQDLIDIINSKLYRDITQDKGYNHPIRYVECCLPISKYINYFMKNDDGYLRKLLLDYGYIYEYYYVLKKMKMKMKKKN